MTATLPTPSRWRSALAALMVGVAFAGPACGSSSEKPKTDAAIEKGLQAQSEGKIAEATKVYNSVLAKDPANKYALYNLGLIDQQAGRTDAAITRYRAALASDPNFEPALFNLAIAVTPTDPQQALTLYKRVIAINPNNAAGHLNLGFLLKSMGQEDEGQTEIDKAVQLDPSLGGNGGASPSTEPPSTTSTAPTRK